MKIVANITLYIIIFNFKHLCHTEKVNFISNRPPTYHLTSPWQSFVVLCRVFGHYSVIVCPSVRLGLTMVKFSYSLVRHHETAMYAVK